MTFTDVFQAGGFSLPLGKKTYVMGILNVTPDSFSDGGKYLDPEAAAQRAFEIQAEGADIIDIGACSTRPGAFALDPAEENARLLPVFKAIEGRLNIPVSIDTVHEQTARLALDYGACIINCVSGALNPALLALAAERGAGYVAMHNSGGADKTDTAFPDGVVAAVRSFFEKALAAAARAGLGPQRLCFDPGIGFGKSYTDNLCLIRCLREMKTGGCAILVGASRKRLIGTASGEAKPENRLAGTIAAHTIAIAGGADIIRVHDVAQAVQAAKTADSVLRQV
ncbi:MAG TPA: dihydropteroate synthase [Clostridiales bacterium]|nr:dihydropteroate synthase [Clostridiales bacterium]HQH62421.1 dihydropteroate synthase [Clostridiales bacterium]HQK72656.1 dihydropteroate synthase [Clostridiales bacterium]